jgi:hypothetical protein
MGIRLRLFTWVAANYREDLVPLPKILRQSEIRAQGYLGDILPLVKAVPDVGRHCSEEQYACQERQIYDLSCKRAHVVIYGSGHFKMGYTIRGLYAFEKTSFICWRFIRADCACRCAHAVSLMALHSGHFHRSIANPGQQGSDRRHVAM